MLRKKPIFSTKLLLLGVTVVAYRAFFPKSEKYVSSFVAIVALSNSRTISVEKFGFEKRL